MKRIKVTGYINIEDDEFDPGISGPLTNEAYEEWIASDIECIEDLTFTVVPD